MKFTKEDLIRASEELGFATDSFIQYINDTVEENDKDNKNVCHWTHECENIEPYYTDCGVCFIPDADEIEDGKFRFCPYCGKPIEIIETPEGETHA